MTILNDLNALLVEHAELPAAVNGRLLAQDLRELVKKWKITEFPSEPKKEYSWECNECGSQEYTMSVSEDDVHDLGCGSCGGNEWHKCESRS